MAKPNLYDDCFFEPRNKMLKVYLTEDEFKDLEAIVLEKNISKSSYVRDKLFDFSGREKLQEEIQALRRQQNSLSIKLDKVLNVLSDLCRES